MPGHDAPILEFDPSPTAVIEPTDHIDLTDIPRRAVLCFFQDVIARAVEEFDGREIDEVRSEIGLVPVYEIVFDGCPLALVHPGDGADASVPPRRRSCLEPPGMIHHAAGTRRATPPRLGYARDEAREPGDAG